MSSSKEIILQKIKEAILQKDKSSLVCPDLTTSIYPPLLQPLELQFKKSLEAVGGQVFLCDSESDLLSKVEDLCRTNRWDPVFCLNSDIRKKIKNHQITLHNEFSEFEAMQAGITGCEALIAHTGSVMISSHGESGRRMNVFPPQHIVLAGKKQLVDFLNSAFELLSVKYRNDFPSLVSVITGPSRTADIEKTLVMGAHGPEGLYVFINLEE